MKTLKRKKMNKCIALMTLLVSVQILSGCAEDVGAHRIDLVDFLVSIAREDRKGDGSYYRSMDMHLINSVENAREAEEAIMNFVEYHELPKEHLTECRFVDGMYYMASEFYIVYLFPDVGKVRYFSPK